MEPQGKLWGFVPYDFGLPTWTKFKERVWNPEEERIWTPRTFGLGWDINLFQLRERYPAAFYALIVLVLLRLAKKIRKR